MKRSRVLSIAGTRVQIKTDYDQAYLDELAAFVEERLLEVQSTKTGNRVNEAVIAALNIAARLFDERSKHEALREEVKTRCERIRRLMESVAS